MKRKMTFTAVAAAAALALAACGDAPDEESDDDTGADETSETDDGDETETDGEAGADIDGSDFTGCMVSDEGGFDDQSFNQSGAEGLQDAVDQYGIQDILVESHAEADFDPNIDSLLQQGCDLIFGVGFMLEAAIQSAADANQDVEFGLVDAVFTDDNDETIDVENGRPLVFNTAEAAFLAGYASAGMSESGVVATFGGIQIPAVTIFMDGFVDGVDAYNEDNDAEVTVLGWDKDDQDGSFSGDFSNQAAGQTLTENFISQGADVIMPVAGPVGLGSAAAAQNAGDVMIVGVDSDWYESTEYGEIVLTSVVKEIGASVLETVTQSLEGEFTSEPYVGDLENGGVSIAPFHDFEDEVPQELVDRLDELTDEIISGDRVIESPSEP